MTNIHLSLIEKCIYVDLLSFDYSYHNIKLMIKTEMIYYINRVRTIAISY